MTLFRLVCLALIWHNNGYFTNGAEIHLSFKELLSSKKDFVDQEVSLAPESTNVIIASDIPNDIHFLIIQAHAFIQNVTLTANPILSLDNHVNGTNIGLHVPNHIGMATLFLNNYLKTNVSVLVAAVPYSDENPVPGGCNIEAPMRIKPFLNLELTPSMVIVDGAPASISSEGPSAGCDSTSFTYLMFFKYLPEQDFTIKTYFEAIRSMLSYPAIESNGFVASKSIDGPLLTRYFNRYSGTGTVYSLVAFSNYGSAVAYTPTFTYACDDISSDKPCELLSSPIWKIELAFFMTLSILICCTGHRYFVGELFYMAAFAGGLLCYIILLLQANYVSDVILISTGVGLASGVVWVAVWCLISSPIVSVSLPFLIKGFLAASTFFFFFLSGTGLQSEFIQSDYNYWLSFVALMLLVFLLSTTNPVRYNILACSFVGSYGFILPLDYYIGTNLKYILINVIRRATVEGYSGAITKPPLQAADIIQVAIWIILTIVGYKSQKKLSGNRSPFPPVCLTVRERPPDTVPILSEARYPTYTLVL